MDKEIATIIMHVHVHVHVHVQMLKVAKQQVCIYECMCLYVTYVYMYMHIPKVQRSLYFQHNSCSGLVMLQQYVHVHVHVDRVKEMCTCTIFPLDAVTDSTVVTNVHVHDHMTYNVHVQYISRQNSQLQVILQLSSESWFSQFIAHCIIA